MSSPLVSVIVPSYNHEKYIIRALTSVVRQVYRPIEIILVDDGSTDGTFELARDFLGNNYPSALVVSQTNMGAARTINKAISYSNGKYVNVLNSDDYFEPGRIESCVQIAERYGQEFIYTGLNYTDPTDRVLENNEYVQFLRRVEKDSASLYPSLGFAFLKNQLAVTTGNMFMSRRLIDVVGPFNSYLYVHDWDFVLRSLFYVEPYFLPERLYNYRLHGENSFRSLRYVEGYETKEVMTNALWRFTARVPLNGRCPSPHCWPGVFEKLIDRWGYNVYLPPRFRNEYAGVL
ncbi:glycosyl family 2 [Methylobacterium sp. GXF4]|nr:glycosyl family 2 [Methylobacterium sp. GXF4]